jgi:hypothetical protein
MWATPGTTSIPSQQEQCPWQTSTDRDRSTTASVGLEKKETPATKTMGGGE